jgi:GNAT superfamily N-acetyltransferase
MASLSFVQVETALDVETARSLFREYEASLPVDLGFQDFKAEVVELPRPYVPPRGALLLACDSEQVAGCGALRPWTDAVCELKRMFVRPAFRGRGYGRALAEALIERAQAAGYRSMRLDTLNFMSEAASLYRSLGFEPIDRYYSNPHPGTVFLELSLV